MADVLQGTVWLAGPTGERCTDKRTEPLGWAITRRKDSEFHPLLGNTRYDVEVTHLWTLEEIPFDVPAGAVVRFAVVEVGGRELRAELDNGATDFPSAGVFNLQPLDVEVKERI